MLTLLPLVTLAIASSTAEPMTPRVAQVELVEALASADAIEAVRAHDHVVTVAIDRDGRALDVTATIGFRGAVLALAITDTGAAHLMPGALDWMAPELTDVAAITNLVVDHANVVLVTDDERRYLAIPARDHVRASDTAVEARWAAAWDTEA